MQALEDVGDVLLRGGGRDAERTADLLVRRAVGNEPQDLPLSRRQNTGTVTARRRAYGPQPGSDRIARIRELTADDAAERTAEHVGRQRRIEVAGETVPKRILLFLALRTLHEQDSPATVAERLRSAPVDGLRHRVDRRIHPAQRSEPSMIGDPPEGRAEAELANTREGDTSRVQDEYGRLTCLRHETTHPCLLGSPDP